MPKDMFRIDPKGLIRARNARLAAIKDIERILNRSKRVTGAVKDEFNVVLFPKQPSQSSGVNLYTFVEKMKLVTTLVEEEDFFIKVFYADNAYGFTDIRVLRSALAKLARLWEGSIKFVVKPEGNEGASVRITIA